jgi:hypothetical protein
MQGEADWWCVVVHYCDMRSLLRLSLVNRALHRRVLLPSTWLYAQATLTLTVKQWLPAPSEPPRPRYDDEEESEEEELSALSPLLAPVHLPASLRAVRSMYIACDYPCLLDTAPFSSLLRLTLTCTHPVERIPTLHARVGDDQEAEWLDSRYLLQPFLLPAGPYHRLSSFVMENVWVSGDDCEWLSVFNRDTTPALSTLELGFGTGMDDGPFDANALRFSISRSFFVGLSTLPQLTHLSLLRIRLGLQHFCHRVSPPASATDFVARHHLVLGL